jgi:hypothetical protein
MVQNTAENDGFICMPPVNRNMELRNLPEVKGPKEANTDKSETREFVNAVMSLIESKFETTRQDVEFWWNVDTDVDDVITWDNIDVIDVEAGPYQNPTVTVFVEECPKWADDQWEERFHPFARSDKDVVTNIIVTETE